MKRPHSATKAAQKPHKRPKIISNFAKPLPTKTKRKVRLDELGWKAVPMPDRLEDTEGFYGLEEIDDVTIVKDPTTGNLTFETTKTEEEIAKDVEEAWQREEEEAKRLEQITFSGEGGPANDDKGPAEEVSEKPVQKESEDVEWEGFSDDEDAPVDVELSSTAEDDIVDTNGDVSAYKDEKNDKKKKKEPKEKKEKKGAEKEQTPVSGVDNDDGEESDSTELSDGETFGPSAFDILADQPIDDDDEVDVSAWEELNLSEQVLDALAKLNFQKPTEIQASTIPEIMAGRDVIGKASTGSGKTLAFGIPIIESFLSAQPGLKDSKDHTPIALIVAPTRELAHQITAHLIALCTKGDFNAPHIASITGGLSVQKQRRQLEKADIVVGTPGRLWEVISTGQGLLEKFKQIRFLVIDEADRLLSDGHYQELGDILKILEPDSEAVDGENDDATPELNRQTLVFSATFGKSLQQKLAGKSRPDKAEMSQQASMEYLLKKLKFREEKPKFIDANPNSQMANKLKEGLIECAGPEKDLYLYSLLMFYSKKRALVFTNSISAVRRLTPYLCNLDLPALPLHSNMAQKARLRSIERFKERPGSILVATDVAARGLDIPKVELVIHYHLPRAADTYVHRSGRTARADASGTSILICAPEEVAGVRRLVAKVHARSSSNTPTTPGSKPSGKKKPAYFIRTLDLDRRIISRLRPRAQLSKRLADTVIAKEKAHAESDVLRQAADDLGIDYDSDEFDREAPGRKGRGTGRKKKEKEASAMTKAEMGALRAQLKALLSQRINTGVSARYLTSGGVDVDALVRGEGNSGFLGSLGGLGVGFED
ncbi:ATP-dependent RNA helicase [Plenodomus lingam]|uniref:ATP-dependent RNA helicase n=1 Tax=Leptosphaeria maculans (strain JN3 / isolate v23.1.3 / race Av1-4-5-6-7-8) TaxID=985895 RepID=E4ZY55_LEPMJ|nr:similar to ATP-dependent RNA helicase MAK5 [Plenodomus lingam JN3]KAH9879656.1 ATP-dependent RNA helicase [Plenodomus lingam]CBX96300.1 similar to ATP-dependent RNA helicase MAK5 [Plenodomus lingam JN3]